MVAYKLSRRRCTLTPYSADLLGSEDAVPGSACFGPLYLLLLY